VGGLLYVAVERGQPESSTVLAASARCVFSQFFEGDYIQLAVIGGEGESQPKSGALH